MPSIHELSRFFDRYLDENRGRLERANERDHTRMQAIGELLQAIDDGHAVLTYRERGRAKDNA